jgi:hypothetical protein
MELCSTEIGAVSATSKIVTTGVMELDGSVGWVTGSVTDRVAGGVAAFVSSARAVMVTRGVVCAEAEQTDKRTISAAQTGQFATLSTSPAEPPLRF